MRAKEFLDQLKHEAIISAIKAAELRTSGELRVFVSRQEVADPMKAAELEFLRLGMNKTAERNGVLIFVAPRSSAFAVIGDQAIHGKCGPVFWEQLAAAMAEDFKAGDFTAGILRGIQRAGELAAVHFPRKASDENELSDSVAHD